MCSVCQINTYIREVYDLRCLVPASDLRPQLCICVRDGNREQVPVENQFQIVGSIRTVWTQVYLFLISMLAGFSLKCLRFLKLATTHSHGREEESPYFMKNDNNSAANNVRNMIIISQDETPATCWNIFLHNSAQKPCVHLFPQDQAYTWFYLR